MATISEALAIAIQHQQGGRLQAAEQIYRQILQVEPNQADAIHLLGGIAHQVGKHEMAVEYMSRAIALQGKVADFHYNLAIVYNAVRRTPEAIGCLRRAVELNPDFALAHNNLGVALTAQGKLDDAVACCRRALELKPDLAEAHNNLGNALREQGKLDQAVACFRRAVELKPDLAEAHNNLGIAYREKGKLEEAIACSRGALELKPDFAEAHNNLGVAFLEQRRLEEAAGCFHRALELKPDFTEAHSNLGVAFTEQGKLEEAVACSRRALELKPDFAGAYSNLGSAFKDQGRLEEALAAYRSGMALEPHNSTIHSNLIYTQIFLPGSDAHTLREECVRWTQCHAAPLAKSIQPHLNDRSPNRKLRVGYVSPDFLNHAESYFVAPLFAAHHHECFEIHAYSSVRKPDQVTARLRRCADYWHEVATLSNAELAAMIRADQIDLLIDLSMHMAHNRLPLFARKPAPIQIAWLAYPGSTGLTAMDYRLTDPFLDPEGENGTWSSEEPIRLPDSWVCYQPHPNLPEPAELPAHRLGAITFGSLNNFCKINDRVLELWARVLTATNRSRLVLLAKRGNHRSRTVSFLQERGVSADRIEFLDLAPTETYLHYYNRVDIALDPFPYNGVTTSCDALSMGVPVVTLIGPMAAGRTGWSLLSNIGLAECAARTEEEYVCLAAGLAQDLSRLSELRATLRDRMQSSPLMNAPRFAQNIEAAYRRVWQRWCATNAAPKASD